ncbi:uncharacterized protein LOC135471414 [Liolophura sinensis]|uniref:uncharacterized protein LOC135471414 n=1 Tax=Liolophura sinensis TaxID=3198878 RepID=UPI003159729E
MVSRSSIEEANKHLHALHSRVQQLEQTISKQNETITVKDEEMAYKLHEMSELKEAEITELTAKLITAKEKVKSVENMLREKDQQIHKLQERCRILDRVMGYQPVLENLLTTLASGGSLSDSGISASETPMDDHTHHVKSHGYKGSAIRRMAKNFNSHAGRKKQFSISEDDDEDQNADTEGDSSDDKTTERELYL